MFIQGKMSINTNIIQKDLCTFRCFKHLCVSKCLQRSSNNEIISIFHTLFENVLDLRSLMLQYLQERILTPSEFMIHGASQVICI